MATYDAGTTRTEIVVAGVKIDPFVGVPFEGVFTNAAPPTNTITYGQGDFVKGTTRTSSVDLDTVDNMEIALYENTEVPQVKVSSREFSFSKFPFHIQVNLPRSISPTEAQKLNTQTMTAVTKRYERMLYSSSKFQFNFLTSVAPSDSRAMASEIRDAYYSTTDEIERAGYDIADMVIVPTRALNKSLANEYDRQSVSAHLAETFGAEFSAKRVARAAMGDSFAPGVFLFAPELLTKHQGRLPMVARSGINEEKNTIWTIYEHDSAILELANTNAVTFLPITPPAV